MIRLKLDTVLKEQGMSRSLFSEITGIPWTTLHLLYHNKANSIRIKDLERLCDMTGLKPGDFFEYEFDEEPSIPVRIKNRGRKKKRSEYAT